MICQHMRSFFRSRLSQLGRDPFAGRGGRYRGGWLVVVVARITQLPYDGVLADCVFVT
jgi:hypothetical protein